MEGLVIIVDEWNRVRWAGSRVERLDWDDVKGVLIMRTIYRKKLDQPKRDNLSRFGQSSMRLETLIRRIRG